ncbi:hypothetical protein HMPREF3291_05410, partial [Bacillus sp. HMSC76G11]
MANQNNGKMSPEEAGRKGGQATADSHDKEFYQEIGQKGGQANAAQQNQSNHNSSSSDNNGKMSREEAGRK